MKPDEIASLRKQLGWTQEQMARELGTVLVTVNRWENGRTRPSKLALAALTRLAQRTRGRRQQQDPEPPP